MVHQATINGRHTAYGGPRMGRSLAGLGHDVLTLAELQARLLAVDLSEGRTRA